MGNKLKHIQLVNVLLEQRYLKEQAPTGTTQSTTGATTSGSVPPTQPTNTTPQPSSPTKPISPPPPVAPSVQAKPIVSLDQLKKMSEKDISNKIMKCKEAGEVVYSTNNIKIHQMKDGVNYCLG